MLTEDLYHPLPVKEGTPQFQVKVLSVRLTEPEMRRFKSLAASRGVSVQKAVQQALNLWESQSSTEQKPDALDELRGSLPGSEPAGNILELRRVEKQAELAKDRRWL